MYGRHLKNVFFVMAFFMASTALAEEYDSFTDERDGNVYKVVKIGRETWLAENVKYVAEEIVCHSDAKHGDSVKNYGCLYSWIDAQKVCPAGFHLPSKVEFDRLLGHIGNGQEGSDNLRAASWQDGKNTYGFSALPVGAHKSESCIPLGSYAYFWSVTECTQEGSNGAYSMVISQNSVSAKSCNSQEDFLSVRCVMDLEDGHALNTFIDQRDGHKYKTIKINEQIWMAENMRYISKNIDYKASEKPGEYGYLYTFADAQKVCPAGFHLPSKIEFDRLLANVYTEGADSENLRHKNWAKGKNLSGFGALPAGKCEKSGCSFWNTEAYFWSSTERNKIIAYGLYVDINKALVSYGKIDRYLSVRCIKDSADAVNKPADSQIFTDPRDGKEYKVVEIDNKLWFAENLRYAGIKHYWPNDDKNIEAVWGYLYEWKKAKKACPPGFHLPTKEEFEDLLEYASADGAVKSRRIASANLRAKSFFNGKDTYGFSALPAGMYWRRRFSDDFGRYDAYFWSSTEHSRHHAYILNLRACQEKSADVWCTSVKHLDKINAYSVRCVRDKGAQIPGERKH